MSFEIGKSGYNWVFAATISIVAGIVSGYYMKKRKKCLQIEQEEKNNSFDPEHYMQVRALYYRNFSKAMLVVCKQQPSLQQPSLLKRIPRDFSKVKLFLTKIFCTASSKDNNSEDDNNFDVASCDWPVFDFSYSFNVSESRESATKEFLRFAKENRTIYPKKKRCGSTAVVCAYPTGKDVEKVYVL